MFQNDDCSLSPFIIFNCSETKKEIKLFTLSKINTTNINTKLSLLKKQHNETFMNFCPIENIEVDSFNITNIIIDANSGIKSYYKKANTIFIDKNIKLFIIGMAKNDIK